MYALFILLGFVSHASLASEPLCSKFAYDEALLEKMIRTEIKVEQFRTEFSEIREEVKNMLKIVEATVKDIRNEKRVMNEDFAELNQSTVNAVNELTKTSNDVLEHQGKQIERMSTDLRDLYTGLQANLTESISTPIIGFKAAGLSVQRPTTDNVIVFPTTLFNSGDGYDSSTGVFTTPISGLYLLTVQVCPSKNDYFIADIMVDETVVGRITAVDVDWTSCNTADAVTYIDVGGKAYIKTTNSAPLHHDVNYMTSFSGALLNKDL